jgi:hypothetical protein
VIDAGAWLASRTPAPPRELATRFASIADGRQCRDEADLARFLVDEATAILASLGNDRSAATDLLVADALITYAMEAASANPEEVAARAMQVISAVPRRGMKA